MLTAGTEGTYRYLHQMQNKGSGLQFASNSTYQKLAPKFSEVVSSQSLSVLHVFYILFIDRTTPPSDDVAILFLPGLRTGCLSARLIPLSDQHGYIRRLPLACPTHSLPARPHRRGVGRADPGGRKPFSPGQCVATSQHLTRTVGSSQALKTA